MSDTEDILEVQPQDTGQAWQYKQPTASHFEESSQINIILTFNSNIKKGRYNHSVSISQIIDYIIYCHRKENNDGGHLYCERVLDNKGMILVLDEDVNEVPSVERILLLQQLWYAVKVRDLKEYTEKLNTNDQSSPRDKTMNLSNMALSEGEFLIPALIRKGVVSQIFPLHDQKEKKELKKGWVYKLMQDLPVQLIRDYFGDEIALYFSFINFYTFLLIIPMILALLLDMFYPGLTTLLERNEKSWGEEKICFVLFSVFNVVWWTLFLHFWQRKSSTLAGKWNTLGRKKATLEIIRPEYHGTTITNDAGELEIFYPTDKRRARQLISMIITLISFGCVVYLTQLILTFKTRGYTLPPPAFLSYILPKYLVYLLPSSIIPPSVIR